MALSDTSPYPDLSRLAALTDISRSNEAAFEFMRGFFEAKNSLDLDKTMSFISPELEVYADSVVGVDLRGFDLLRRAWGQYMPYWEGGKSYPTRVVGELIDGSGNLVVSFTDTPELFGSDVRITGLVDVRDGHVVRWVDYWDSNGFPTAALDAISAPFPEVPAALRYGSPVVPDATAAHARKLQTSLSVGDVEGVTSLIAYDAVWEDDALKSVIRGRDPIARYLGRVIQQVPYGAGAELGHIAGGREGGALEWANRASTVPSGVLTFDVDHDDLLSRVRVVYDGRRLGDARNSLAAATLEPFVSC